MNHYLCIHGHFYQPPRENPWLEAIELQDSAYPFHDWNERITDECYRPNGRSRILDDQERISKIVNNYSRISFNFGPTLLSWLELHVPDVYRAVLEADRSSRERFGGHGSALAQAYNHMILPLASERDRRTQVAWGIRDFEHRFRRRPEGMWLPETACDTSTLETLADFDIAFTVLAPSQAARTKPLHGGRWHDERGAVDPSRPYEARLPSGRSVTLFFYDGPISQAVAFEGLLNSGETFARRLLGGLAGERDGPQLMHIATDGETYGHHHRHGDMALAFALDHIDARDDVELINYGQYLEKHPPQQLVEIVEASSWSCVHGVDRWARDCGCHTGGHADWNQRWRAPLREALDWLRDEVSPRFEARAAELLDDPWTTRDDYIDVVLDRSPERVETFLSTHARHALDDVEKIEALRLLELQRHAMLMYTSCGWFFDELSRIETVQVIRYAARAIQIARELFDEDLETPFLDRLRLAESNDAEEGSGADIYLKRVKPAMIDLREVGAHFAINSIFEDYGPRTVVYCYDVELRDMQRLRAGRTRLHIGRATVTSRITWNSEELSFAALHLGEHVINGAVRRYAGEESYRKLVETGSEIFDRADFAEMLRALDALLGAATYSLASLFRDEQRKVVNRVLASTLAHVEASYERLYEQYAPMCRFLSGLATPIPPALRIPAHFVIHAGLREGLRHDPPQIERVHELLQEATRQSVELDEVTLAFTAEQSLRRLATALEASPHDFILIERLWELVGLIRELPFEVDLAEVQNVYYALCARLRPELLAATRRENDTATHWLGIFDDLGQRLGMRVE